MTKLQDREAQRLHDVHTGYTAQGIPVEMITMEHSLIKSHHDFEYTKTKLRHMQEGNFTHGMTNCARCHMPAWFRLHDPVEGSHRH